MSHIVTIADSPCPTIKSSAVLNYAYRILKRGGAHLRFLSLHDLSAEDLLHQRSTPAIEAASLWLEAAQGVLITTSANSAIPIGTLSAFLGLLPQEALAEKTVLPLAIGGTPADWSRAKAILQPILRALGSRSVLSSLHIPDSHIQFAHGGRICLEEPSARSLQAALLELLTSTQRPV